MGVAGQVGAGAAQGLEELLRRQMLEAAQAERQRQFDTRIQQDRAEMDQRGQIASEELKGRNRALDIQDSERRDRSTRAGVEDMNHQREIMDNEEAGRGLDALANDQSLPSAVRTIVGLQRRGVRGVSAGDLEDPNAKAKRELDTYKSHKQIDAQYRDRTSGSDAQEWVIRNNQPTPIRKGGAQPGDRPYDAVAQRQGAPVSNDEAKDTARDVQRIASDLRKHKGLSGVFGVLDSRMPTIRQGTADAEVLLKSLQGLLTLENTGKLKGVLSNADMEVLRRASTTLDAQMSEPAAQAELDRLVEVMQKVTGEGGAPAGGGSGPKVGEQRTINGQRAQWDGNGWLPVK